MNYDAFGRATESFYPCWNTQNQLTAFEPEFSTTRPTVTDFDILDRATTVTLPDLTQASTEHGFGQDKVGRPRHHTRSRDGNGVVSDRYTSVRGLLTGLCQSDRVHNQQSWTQYRYSALDELETVIDANDNRTQAYYDGLGCRVSLNNPVRAEDCLRACKSVFPTNYSS